MFELIASKMTPTRTIKLFKKNFINASINAHKNVKYFLSYFKLTVTHVYSKFRTLSSNLKLLIIKDIMYNETQNVVLVFENQHNI